MNIEELRSEFEKTKTFKKTHYWALDFDEIKQVYYSIHYSHIAGAVAVNAAWMMFQELKK